MKAKIKKDLLILIPESKKEREKLRKFIDKQAGTAVIPKSRAQLAYFHIQDIAISIL